jgi:hypothetical protein
MSLTAVALSLLLVSQAPSAETCTVQATQWLQDGALRGSPDGPALALAAHSPELLAVEVELSAEPGAARVSIADSVARVDAWMSHEDLRLRAARPLSFADDTIYTGKLDLRVLEVDATGVKVAPKGLPLWFDVTSSISSTVACDDLDLVETWPGDLRPLALGSAARGERVFLKPGAPIELSRIPGTSPALTLNPPDWTMVEAVSKDTQAVRILVRFEGGIAVGWVDREAVADERPPVEEAEPVPPQPPVAPRMEGEVKVCKKGAPLWARAGEDTRILGTLEPGAGVLLGEKTDDGVEVLAVPSATAWYRAPDARWWLDGKAARGCK